MRFNLKLLILLQRFDISFKFVGRRSRLEKEGRTKGDFMSSILKRLVGFGGTPHISSLSRRQEAEIYGRNKVMEFEWADIMENSEAGAVNGVLKFKISLKLRIIHIHMLRRIFHAAAEKIQNK